MKKLSIEALADLIMNFTFLVLFIYFICSGSVVLGVIGVIISILTIAQTLKTLKKGEKVSSPSKVIILIMMFVCGIETIVAKEIVRAVVYFVATVGFGIAFLVSTSKSTL